VLADMWYTLANVDGNCKGVECDMTRAEIAQARKMATDWLRWRGERLTSRDIISDL
jgi:hypothetical protein